MRVKNVAARISASTQKASVPAKSFENTSRFGGLDQSGGTIS